MVTTAVTEPQRFSGPDDDEKPGWAGQWIRHDPVRGAAALLIAIPALRRAQVGVSAPGARRCVDEPVIEELLPWPR